MWRNTLILVLVVQGVGLGKEIPPEEGTYYPYSKVGLREPEVVNGSRLDLVFKPTDEQFYWCPGIRVIRTKVAVVITFVRCKTSEDSSVDTKATIEKSLMRKLSVDTHGLDVYVRNGPKSFQRIYKSPTSKLGRKKGTGTKQNDGDEGATDEAGSQELELEQPKPQVQTKDTGIPAPLLIRPIDQHTSKRELTNFLVSP